MYRYFSYSKILRNSRPPFYYKKNRKIFSQTKKKEVQEKKHRADTFPPTGKASIRRQNSRKVMRQPHIPIKGVLTK